MHFLRKIKIKKIKIVPNIFLPPKKVDVLLNEHSTQEYTSQRKPAHGKWKISLITGSQIET